MVATITLNPSLDYWIEVLNPQIGILNRTLAEAVFPGGKGINVSILLSRLGIENEALGFLAGFTGKEIEQKLQQEGCKTKFIQLKDGLTRINVKVRGDEETEFNARGPRVSDAELNQLYRQVGSLRAGDYLVMSGSVPAGMPLDVYSRILSACEGRDLQTVIDTTGQALWQTLPFRPFLIKPNHHELGELFGTDCASAETALELSSRLQKEGARNVLVSMAGAGAVFLGEKGETFCLPAPKGSLKNSVGAGDSMVAGFLAEYIKTQDMYAAFRFAVAAGSASAFSPWLAEPESIEDLLTQI
ncbi:1-phosphofructokinase [Massiliimalia timonensis]|uniref:1-phosphofructokinase n=1 Tax=Massiliimalia timonensis TaxID=1987501 RepID=UPI000B8A68B7|nr:1-phosphofructokinase [Massiliimalia timonensis]MBS7176196.1 1-phosphofructokinase [Clostridiales bacterium]